MKHWANPWKGAPVVVQRRQIIVMKRTGEQNLPGKKIDILRLKMRSLPP